jgi:spore coat polysaccharide biosynthesis protein SpsF
MTADVRIVAIVQARMGSSRFPGKMLATLGNISILEWVFQRLSRATYLDEIVLATSIDKENDVLENIANRCGVRVFRGSESDVLGRFVSAADHAKATNIVRVCADNPFIDPIEVDRLVNFFKHKTCD